MIITYVVLMKNEFYVFFALRNYLELHGTYKIVMNSYMAKHQNDSVASIQKYKTMYNGLIDIIKQVLGETAFFSMTGDVRKKFNGAVYDSIIVAFSYFPKRYLMQHADQIRISIENVKCNDKDYQNNVYVGTNAGARVTGRITKIIKVIHAVASRDAVTQQKRCFSSEDKENLFYEGCICAYCNNQILDINDCEVDHIIPFSSGGPTSIENAQLLHRHCNRSKQATHFLKDSK